MFFYFKNDYLDYILNIIEKIRVENKIKKVTQIQIQKAIYIVYAYFLLFENKICDINFETWRWGPVIYDLWKQQTVFWANNVLLKFDNLLYEKYSKNFFIENKKVETIISFLFTLKSWDVVVICHEQTPWKKLYKPNKNILITDSDIVDFHKESENNFFYYLEFIIKNTLK